MDTKAFLHMLNTHFTLGIVHLLLSDILKEGRKKSLQINLCKSRKHSRPIQETSVMQLYVPSGISRVCGFLDGVGMGLQK